MRLDLILSIEKFNQLRIIPVHSWFFRAYRILPDQFYDAYHNKYYR